MTLTSTHHEKQLSNLFWSQIDNGSAVFKFYTDESWNWAQQMLNEKTFLERDLQSLAAKRGDDSISYRLRVNDKLKVIQISV